MTKKASYKGTDEPWAKVCTIDDWTMASFDFLDGRGDIANEFRYTTVCLHILTGIIAKVSGKPTVEFANETLFEPLNIEPHKHFLALTVEEHKAFTMGKTPKEHIWFGDPKGIDCAGLGFASRLLHLRKQDFCA